MLSAEKMPSFAARIEVFHRVVRKKEISTAAGADAVDRLRRN
jgi:hypothetical protein